MFQALALKRGHLYPREVNITAGGEMDVLTDPCYHTPQKYYAHLSKLCRAVMQPTRQHGFLIYSFHNL